MSSVELTVPIQGWFCNFSSAHNKLNKCDFLHLPIFTAIGLCFSDAIVLYATGFVKINPSCTRTEIHFIAEH